MIKDTKTIEFFRIDDSTYMPLPYADSGIAAGFPSPAQDYLEESIDLNKELIRHPASTFYGKVTGDSMAGEGIQEGDILVIDKSLEVCNNDLVVCYLDGEFTLKRVQFDKEAAWLIPSNPKYAPIKVTPENDFMIWGVVIYTIKKNRRKR